MNLCTVHKFTVKVIYKLKTHFGKISKIFGTFRFNNFNVEAV